jgi:hypothetical protein
MMAHETVRADLLLLGQIMRDLDAREVLWDRFTSVGMLALVRLYLRNALTLRFLCGFDRGSGPRPR